MWLATRFHSLADLSIASVPNPSHVLNNLAMALRGIAHPTLQCQHHYLLPESHSNWIRDTDGQLPSVKVAQRCGVNTEIHVDRSRQIVPSPGSA